MPSAVTLRTDYSAADLRVLAKRTKDNRTHPAWAAGVTVALGSVRLAVLACAVQAA
jgi:hypothetical protein